MNIQIFGKNKCFDTKKAQRWFKERRIKVQYVDVLRCGMSRGELQSVKNAVGLMNMADEKDPDYALLPTSPRTRRGWTSSLRSRSCCARPSCATADRPPWATARRSGRPGNKQGSAPAVIGKC